MKTAQWNIIKWGELSVFDCHLVWVDRLCWICVPCSWIHRLGLSAVNSLYSQVDHRRHSLFRAKVMSGFSKLQINQKNAEICWPKMPTWGLKNSSLSTARPSSKTTPLEKALTKESCWPTRETLTFSNSSTHQKGWHIFSLTRLLPRSLAITLNVLDDRERSEVEMQLSRDAGKCHEALNAKGHD